MLWIFMRRAETSSHSGLLQFPQVCHLYVCVGIAGQRVVFCWNQMCFIWKFYGPKNNMYLVDDE